MPNEITTTYHFSGDSFEEFKKDFLEIAQDEFTVPMDKLFEHYGLEDARCYVEEFDLEDGDWIQTWDAWYPHVEEVWLPIAESYDDLYFTVFAQDNDDLRRFCNTRKDGNHYIVLYEDEEFPDYEFFETLEEAKEFCQQVENPHIYKGKDDYDDWSDEPEEISL